NQGVIVRSNPDGSNFEVYAAGLRNTHEFVFDEYGNLISSDNDGDHRGESERLVHIVEGSDAGWRSNWQYGKYIDPKNNRYNVWMDEDLFKPRWEGQAAYIIPPIMNYHNGPTGMAYNPGTGLGSAWKNNFFLVEFVGNPSRSHIWSFTLKPKGASFDLKEEKDVLSGVLPTGLRFGPDGALYFADWINGWNTKNYGRVWKIDVTEGKNDLKAERAETKRLMTLDYGDQSEAELLKLLSYSDMRIRLKSQFELAKRGKVDVLKQALDQKESQLSRIHGIWGLGQIAQHDIEAVAVLKDVLGDSDPEIIAQSAKIIGDVKYKGATQELISLLTHENSRVKFFAAQALGRLKYNGAVEPLINMIDANNDEDLYIRHAGVLALSRIGQEEPMVALTKSSERDLRIAAVLVLRKLKSPRVALYLEDFDEYIVTEAARAINDDWSIERALPALAATLKEERFTSEPLIRRAINAALRVGGENELDLIISYALRPEAPAHLRAEALATLGTWNEPSVLDRVDGRFRGKIERAPELAQSKVKENISSFLADKQSEVLIAASEMLTNLGITDYNGEMAKMMATNKNPEVRSAFLVALQKLGYSDIVNSIKTGMADADAKVRTAAVGLLASLDIQKDNLPGIVEPIFKKGSLAEQQKLLRVLGDMSIDKTSEVLKGLVEQQAANKL
ncbi:MAG: HEAT repeat domain-containing protein, partial [Cyclobacteriaceae bacterium]|nr:HEAT repeat domain-containing protein [Cyclobacteriaceae bacterium]